MDKLGVKFSQICITNNYLNYSNLKVPEEFNIMAVDEVTNIFESFDENINYDLFVNKGKQILEKYKSQCNVNNSKLILFKDNCKFKNDKYSHGGHGCGNDGKWDEKKCVPLYCDEGYFFDNVQNKCVKDPCLKDNNSTINHIKNIFLIFILVLMLQ